MRADRYAQQLLDALGVDLQVSQQDATNDAVLADWANSGAMALTGRRDGPPQLVNGVPATALRGAILALESLAGATGDAVTLPGETLLGERAAIAGLARSGSASPGGATRLLPAQDGHVAITLSRPDDHSLLPALFEADPQIDDSWEALRVWCEPRDATDIVDRAARLGLAAARIPVGSDEQLRARGQADWSSPFAFGGLDRRRPSPVGQLLVVDLSSLWAGPLCAHLLRLLGARVISVESVRRPDPSRNGPAQFHDLLRGGTESVALDLTMPADIDTLRRLLATADIVIEGSRPRALAQLGIDAQEVVDAPGSRTWVSITAYGRTGPWSNHIGYGDDTAIAAGLTGAGPVFAGDAIGDPLTGVHAAVAAMAGASTGRSHIVDLSMREVVRAAVMTSTPAGTVFREKDAWWLDTGTRTVPVLPPVARTPTEAAPAIGSSRA
jgi:hypothetical protein